MKAVFLDFATLGPNLDQSSMQKVLPGIEIFNVTSDEEVAERIAGAEFILGNKIRINAQHMLDNPGLRFIGLTATGTDNIDLVAAQENGVAVANIRAYCTESIAEHVFGSLLNLTRSLSQYNTAVRAGEWQQAKDFCLLSYPMRELSAMTLGIVGFGDLGRGVQKVARAFGMNVIVSARPGSDAVPDDRVAFDELIAVADVISLHCPLTPETKGLIAADEFRRMKADSILINTARGGLVHSAALVRALEAGEIGGAIIDVLPEEPPVNGNPLLDYAGLNLLMTPHVGWATNEARQAGLDQLMSCVTAFQNGNRQNRVV